jgi:hypothetical protein
MTPQTDTQSIIWSWAAQEIAPWFAGPRDRESVYNRLTALAVTSPAMVAFRIQHGEVEPVGKRRSVAARMDTNSHDRAGFYQAMLQEAVVRYAPELDVLVCLSVADGAHATDDLPTFALQKQRGRPILLLPDIDFLLAHYYEDPEHTDALAYEDKRDHAVFVGGTTGRGVVTEDKVRKRALPRLHAAAHFHGNPDVTFRLPSLCQTESPEVDKLLLELPYCGGERLSWPEQRAEKFLISMDGNGATCSRVAISLKSNSVLLKYDSPHVLYYFAGLVPWTHYVPIGRHEDVDAAIALERAEPGYFAPVAANGRNFAETFLTRENVLFYTAALLSLYQRCFAGADASAPDAVALRHDAAGRRALGVLVHAQSRGDLFAPGGRWAGTEGGGLWIEGFALVPGPGLRAEDIHYRAMLQDGSLTPWQQAPQFCGTRGEGAPIYGVCMRLDGEAARDWHLSYEATFVDGFGSGVKAAGEVCAVAPARPLEALRINLSARRFAL